MNISGVAEIRELLELPAEEFSAITRQAGELGQSVHGGKISVRGMLGYTNICRCKCLYCGMRSPQKIPRYRLSEEEITDLAREGAASGVQRLFLIAGEDPGFQGQKLLSLVRKLREENLTLSLACGELEEDTFRQLSERHLPAALRGRCCNPARKMKIICI